MTTGYTTMRTGNVMPRSQARRASGRPGAMPAAMPVDNRCIR